MKTPIPYTRIFFCLCLAWIILILPHAAYALASSVDNFRCLSNNASNVGLYGARNCTVRADSLFSSLTCSYEQALSHIFGNMYCEMRASILKPVSVLMTLFITVLGILFITGMTKFTVSEAGKALFKMILVLVFATQAEFAIGVAYKFFYAISQEGITIVLSGFKPAGVTSWNGDAAIRSLDKILWNMVNPMALDASAAEAGQKTNYCSKSIILTSAVIVILNPFLFLTVLYMVFETVKVFARAVIGYLLSLTGLAFLLSMTPIFASFALFSVTEKFFEKWLQYVISFTLQIMIIFAAIALIQSVDAGSFFKALLGLIQPYELSLLYPLPIHFPFCSICEYTMQQTPGTTMSLPVCNTPLKIITPGDLPAMTELASMVFIRVAALAILSYVMEAFLRSIPELAKQLAGVPYAPRMGGAQYINPMTGQSSGLDRTSVKLLGGGTAGQVGKSFLQGYNAGGGHFTPANIFGAVLSSPRGVMSGIQKELLGEVGTLGRAGGGGSLAPKVAPEDKWKYFIRPRK